MWGGRFWHYGSVLHSVRRNGLVALRGLVATRPLAYEAEGSGVCPQKIEIGFQCTSGTIAYRRQKTGTGRLAMERTIAVTSVQMHVPAHLVAIVACLIPPYETELRLSRIGILRYLLHLYPHLPISVCSGFSSPEGALTAT